MATIQMTADTLIFGLATCKGSEAVSLTYRRPIALLKRGNDTGIAQVWQVSRYGGMAGTIVANSSVAQVMREHPEVDRAMAEAMVEEVSGESWGERDGRTGWIVDHTLKNGEPHAYVQLKYQQSDFVAYEVEGERLDREEMANHPAFAFFPASEKKAKPVHNPLGLNKPVSTKRFRGDRILEFTMRGDKLQVTGLGEYPGRR